MDTTTVNFAMDKLHSMFKAVHPTVEGLTIDFISYTMMTQILNHIASIIVMLACYFIWKPLYKFARKTEGNYRENSLDTPCFFIPTLILLILFVGSFIYFLTEIPDTILSISYPEMFTIHSIIKK